MTFRILLLLSALAFGSTQAYDAGTYGLGTWNETYAFAANEKPNNTNSVPFSIGTGNYTFQVNIAKLTSTVPVARNRTQDRHYVASFYNLIWEGGLSLNQSLRDAVGTGEEGIPRLCLGVHAGTLSQAATNGYREQDDGDCSNAFGKQCMNDLQKINASQASDCSQSYMPESCKARFGDGSCASTGKFVPYTVVFFFCFSFFSLARWKTHKTILKTLLTVCTVLINPYRPNDQTDPFLQDSPIQFSYYRTQIVTAQDESYYEREDKRLHAVFFSGEWGVTPVCNRVNSTKLGKDSIAVSQGGAVGIRASVGLSVVMAVVVIMFML